MFALPPLPPICTTYLLPGRIETLCVDNHGNAIQTMGCLGCLPGPGEYVPTTAYKLCIIEARAFHEGHYNRCRVFKKT